jgi:hypothetical protein
MKRKGLSELDDDLRPEYRPEDFAGMRAERGKFAKLLRRKSNVVRIAPDLHEAFPNERAVNAALRTLLRKQSGTAAKSVRAAKRAAR